MSDLKTSAEWQAIHPYPKVLDPDGWDRANFDVSWNEPITLEEYQRRVTHSTCMFGKLLSMNAFGR